MRIQIHDTDPDGDIVPLLCRKSFSNNWGIEAVLTWRWTDHDFHSTYRIVVDFGHGRLTYPDDFQKRSLLVALGRPVKSSISGESPAKLSLSLSFSGGPTCCLSQLEISISNVTRPAVVLEFAYSLVLGR